MHFHKNKCKACYSRIVKRVKTSFCQHSIVELSLAQHFFQQMNNSKLDLVNVAFPKSEFFRTFNFSGMLLNIFILLFFLVNPTAKPSKKPSLKPTAQPSRKPTGCFSFIFTIVFVPLCFWGGGAHINCPFVHFLQLFLSLVSNISAAINIGYELHSLLVQGLILSMLLCVC